MDWISIVTLSISGGTFLLLVGQFYVNNKTRNFYRRIGVVVHERRRTQQELYELT